MTELHTPWLDDRVLDANGDRFRDAAAFYIDLVRRVVRTELRAGEDPTSAMTKGLVLLQAFEEGADLPAALPSELYAAEVEDTISILIDRLGATATWEWLRRRHERLYDRTPLRAIVTHEVRRVRKLAEAIPQQQPPAAEVEQHGDQQ